MCICFCGVVITTQNSKIVCLEQVAYVTSVMEKCKF